MPLPSSSLSSHLSSLPGEAGGPLPPPLPHPPHRHHWALLLRLCHVEAQHLHVKSINKTGTFRRRRKAAKSKENCILHEIVQNHKTKVKNILEVARKNADNFDMENFKTTPICETPQGEKLTLNDLEENYIKYHPNWDKKFQCFPG